jgi:hypothetical protein
MYSHGEISLRLNIRARDKRTALVQPERRVGRHIVERSEAMKDIPKTVL